MLQLGEQVRCRGSRAASSETEIRSRELVPRARRKLTRGGVKPSRDAEAHPRGCQALERGGGSWCSAWLSSEAEVRLRGAGAGHLIGRRGFFGPWAPVRLGP
jgi:hypothetical protein